MLKKILIPIIIIVSVFIVSVNVVFVNAAEINLSARSAVVINASTGTVLFEKNAYEQLPMASTTKIMTALLLAEQENLDTLVVTTKQMVTVEGSSMGLLAGDTVSYKDLLYGMLLASGNDAANTTAIALSGSTQDFADLMNRKAQQLGLNNTHFVTPSGLDAEGHYSTAYDMAQLAAYALKNGKFKSAASSKTATLYYGNPPYKRKLSNHNKLLNMYEGAIGVKTGYTKKSGRCLVSAAERDGTTVVAVTLNAPDDWSDHKRLLDYGFLCTKNTNLTDCFTSASINVVGSDKAHVDLSAGDCFVGLTKAEMNNITYTLDIPRFVYAPVKAGEEVGTINYYLNDKLVGTAPLSIKQDAPECEINEASFLEKFLANLITLLKDL